MRTRSKTLLIFFALVSLAALGVFFVRYRFSPPPLKPPSAGPEPSSSVPEAPAREWPTPFSVKLRDLPPRQELPPGTLRILVVGDSVAKFLGLAMRYRQDEVKAFVAERGVGSCNIFASTPYVERGKRLMSSSCSMHWTEDVSELHPDVTLVVMGGAFLNEKSCERAFQKQYQARIFELVRGMGANAGRVVLTRVPYPMRDWRHGKVLQQADCLNEMLVETARLGGLGLLDLMSYLCPTPACIAESGGKPVRPDGLHFDGGGAEETARWVLSEMWRLSGAEKNKGE